jgi:hypothetical protein
VSEDKTSVASPHESIFGLGTPFSPQCRPRKVRNQEAQGVAHRNQDGRRLWGSRTVVVPINQAAKPRSDLLTQDYRTTHNTRWNNGFVNPVTRNRGGTGRLDDCEALKEEQVTQVTELEHGIMSHSLRWMWALVRSITGTRMVTVWLMM